MLLHEGILEPIFMKTKLNKFRVCGYTDFSEQMENIHPLQHKCSVVNCMHDW